MKVLICRICGCWDYPAGPGCHMVEVEIPPRRDPEIMELELPEGALDAMDRAQAEAEAQMQKGIDEERENWKFSRD